MSDEQQLNKKEIAKLSKEFKFKELMKCGKDPVYFINEYCKIQHPIRGRVLFKTYPFQDDVIKCLQEHRLNIVCKSRQLGLSTVCAAYVLWQTLFYKNKNVLVIATKQTTAENFIKKVKFILKELPSWLVMPTYEENVKSVKFNNGSIVNAIPNSPDAGRSEAVSFLVVDECVGGDTKIKLRNKNSKEEFEISIENFYKLSSEENNIEILTSDLSYSKNYDHQVLTPDGWSDFDGIKLVEKEKYIKIYFTNGTILDVSNHHLLKKEDGDFIKAEEIFDGMILFDNKIVLKTEIINEEIELYDLINVEKKSQYYTNDIVSHNCAWIQNFSEIWSGLSPTLSLGGSAVLISSPNGTGNLYHKIWTEAVAGLNNFNPIKLPWFVHPEHDQAWFDNESKNLPPRMISQEMLCDFASSGDTYIPPESMKFLFEMIRNPEEKTGYDRNVWIWRKPVPDRRYIISADPASGLSKDYSAFHVIDCENGECVVEYMGKATPDRLTELMIEYGKLYNNALLCPENNTYGFQVATKLRDQAYPRLYYHGHTRGDPFTYVNHDHTIKPGVPTNGGTRNMFLNKLEELIRQKKIFFYSQRLYDQLQTFVWIGTKAQASKDNFDDLVMSAAIGAWLTGGSSGNGKTDTSFTEALLKATSIEKQSIVGVQRNLGVSLTHSNNMIVTPRMITPGMRIPGFDPKDWLK